MADATVARYAATVRVFDGERLAAFATSLAGTGGPATALRTVVRDARVPPAEVGCRDVTVRVAERPDGTWVCLVEARVDDPAALAAAAARARPGTSPGEGDVDRNLARAFFRHGFNPASADEAGVAVAGIDFGAPATAAHAAAAGARRDWAATLRGAEDAFARYDLGGFAATRLDGWHVVRADGEAVLSRGLTLTREGEGGPGVAAVAEAAFAAGSAEAADLTVTVGGVLVGSARAARRAG